MKATTLKKAALIAGSLSFLAGSAFSQTAVSGAGGYKTETLPVGFNVIGISLLNPVITSGTLTAGTSGMTLEDTAATDFTTVLNDPAATYVVEILDGAAAGEVAEITNIQATTFDTAGSLSVASGDSYQLRSAPTLNEVFGTSLTGSFNAAAADAVWLPDGSGGFNTYFYSTSGNEFRNTATPFAVPAKPIAAYYPDGLLVQVKANATSVVITGMVKTTDTVVAVNNGFNVSAVNAPVGQTLGNSGLQATLAGSFNAAAADIVWQPTGPGTFDTYFYNSGAAEWKTTAAPFGPDQGAVTIGSGILIQRKGASLPDGAKVTVPSFYANL